jgi:hypothetical protein
MILTSRAASTTLLARGGTSGTSGDRPTEARPKRSLYGITASEASSTGGRRCPASKALGIMAHMLGDVAQPMHTDQIDAEESVHSGYETAVDSRCTATSCRYRARNDGWDGGGAYARTRALARRAHVDYRELVRRYRRGGYTAAVDKITRRQLNRGANVLADLIRSL